MEKGKKTGERRNRWIREENGGRSNKEMTEVQEEKRN